MLDCAASRLGADVRIAWQQANALKRPFVDALFDFVCCQFGAMFFSREELSRATSARDAAPGR